MAVIAAGCGLGPGKGTSDVGLVVTKGFGTTQIGSVTQRRVPGSETVIRMLSRSFPISTRYGGGFVESIAGSSGSPPHLDWFYYVNGVEAPKGAASTAVHQGDRIWWDLHDWSATNSIPAVVGSFPEPFLHGVGGKRLPVTVECATDVSAACNRVTSALRAVGVPSAQQALATGSGINTVGVVVGTWSDLRVQRLASVLRAGPTASGVYARFSGSSLELLDPRGANARTLGSGAGLIAATAEHGSAPIWVITGTDTRGVDAAAAALSPGRLHDRFALAVSGGTDIPLPMSRR